MNFELRDELVRPYILDGEIGGCGISRLKGVPLNVLEKLIVHGFVRLGEWNSCAGVQNLFLPFLLRHPDFTAHGYAVSKERQDSRIVIEGIECDAPMTMETVIDFANTFHRADEFSLSSSRARCWYD